jgi:glycosyltransferase involved in cell wall biosynthesis
MNPLMKNLEFIQITGVIRFYGDLADDEIEKIRGYQPQLSAIGWRLEFPGTVRREKMLEVMQQADGLLLLSASQAALPSKLFEYLATGLPIGFVSGTASATEKLLSSVPQAVNLKRANECFLTASVAQRWEIPTNYDEASLLKQFRRVAAL